MASAFEQHASGGGGGDTVTLCLPLILRDDPSRFTELGAFLVDGDEAPHLALGDVICIRSRPSAQPYCCTAAPVFGMCENPEYTLPPNTQPTLDEVLEPPWTATHRRWHRYKNENGIFLRHDGGYRKQHIRTMAERGRWAEADVVIVELGLLCVVRGIGLAVRECRTVASGICHELYTSIARISLQMEIPAPDFFLPGLRHALFDAIG